MIPGKTPRNIEINEGESLSSVIMRVASDEFPINKVQSWYCDSLPVSTTLELKSGQMLAGTPKVDGGNA